MKKVIKKGVEKGSKNSPGRESSNHKPKKKTKRGRGKKEKLKSKELKQ